MLRLPLMLASAMAGMIIVPGLAYALPEGRVVSSGAIPKKMPPCAAELLAAVALPPVQNELNFSRPTETEGSRVARARARHSHGHGRRRTYHHEAVRPASPGRDGETAKTVDGNSKLEQMERLKQIDLQTQDPTALRNPEIIAALGLNLEQRRSSTQSSRKPTRKALKSIQPTITTVIMMGGRMPDEIEELRDKSQARSRPASEKKFRR